MTACVYKFIKLYFLLHGYAPSYREIAAGVNLSSVSSVKPHIKRLLADGLLETEDEGAPRAFRLAGYKLVKADAVPGEVSEDE